MCNSINALKCYTTFQGEGGLGLPVPCSTGTPYCYVNFICKINLKNIFLFIFFFCLFSMTNKNRKLLQLYQQRNFQVQQQQQEALDSYNQQQVSLLAIVVVFQKQLQLAELCHKPPLDNFQLHQVVMLMLPQRLMSPLTMVY